MLSYKKEHSFVARWASGEKVSSASLIDLFVNKDGQLSEVYEVKTDIGRQMLYTAIGQVVTHATNGTKKRGEKFLVVPADEDIPNDIKNAIAALGICVRRFRLKGTSRNRVIELV